MFIIERLAILKMSFLSKKQVRDFPGGPMVRTPRFHCRGPRFHPLIGELRSLKPRT